MNGQPMSRKEFESLFWSFHQAMLRAKARAARLGVTEDLTEAREIYEKMGRYVEVDDSADQSIGR